MKSRVSWDEYFFSIARVVASRATCPRKQVGVVVVFNKRILSTGYNGAPSGMRHCTDVGCSVKNDHCTNAIHAEYNALTTINPREKRVLDMYLTLEPCPECKRYIERLFPNMVLHWEEDYENYEKTKRAGVVAVTSNSSKVESSVRSRVGPPEPLKEEWREWHDPSICPRCIESVISYSDDWKIF